MSFWDFFRRERWPHIFCPGCGIGMVLNALWKAFEETEQEPEKWAFVSGIGCTARAPAYMRVDSLHTLHGRAIAFATGLKLGNPELNVMVFSGDGDIASIGGNHLIHAARRNMDLKVIMINNGIYGMTGGQYSPLSGVGVMATTTPYGNIDHEFDIVEMARAAGASFVARTTTYHAKQATDLIRQAIIHEGFSVVEILSQCPTQFGRRNKGGSAAEMMETYKTNTTPIGSKAKKENPDLIERGIFVQKDMPEYCNEYDKIIDQAMKGQ